MGSDLYHIVLLLEISHMVNRAHVKRVVVTSSIAAVISTDSPDGLYTEEKWNDEVITIVREQGRDAPGVLKYIASKALSEKGKLEW